MAGKGPNTRFYRENARSPVASQSDPKRFVPLNELSYSSTPSSILILLHQREPLPTTFSCLFCNHENCILIKLNKKLGLGNLTCKICGQRFQTGINYLSAAVDVYSDWVDACDAVAKEGGKDAERGAPAAESSNAAERDEVPFVDDDEDAY
ncbi:conserved hypothetical protein [Uncinocarpus reesii 1704]|uniref:Transcription elongation factor 1 homolog n=1 Tax=Uncinocarpus reesii (strain UAMH 1704) TaxID=336963 RepID=C4JMJ2_UNCRE|nr:uncharacterized protein UREG_04050 [Uncinocarpus reesii 1704]EEP79204.1 conserved hypothetical protein [Uncinocarpus reesii 1704]